MKTRRLFAGAPALTAALILSGCSPLVSFVTSITNAAAGATIVPVVGDCWHADFDAIDTESSWANGRPVGCSQSHQSYTFAVETLREKFTGSSIDPATGFVRDDIDVAVAGVCDETLSRLLPPHNLENRLETGYFVPPPGAWAAGSRWVRCDIALIAFGSSFDSPRLATLPARIEDLVAAVTRSPEVIALCIDTKDPVADSDPFGSDTATYADCAGDPQWREASENVLPGDEAAPFPSEKARNAFDQANCGDPAEAAQQTWTTYEPTSESWQTGDRLVECWVANGTDVDAGVGA